MMRLSLPLSFLQVVSLMLRIKRLLSKVILLLVETLCYLRTQTASCIITSRARECVGGIVSVCVRLFISLSVPFCLSKYVKTKARKPSGTCPMQQVSSQAQMAVDSGVLATFLLLASVDLPF